MRHKVFFYLFVFSVLIIALLYNTNRNMMKSEEKKIEIAHKRIAIVRDSLKLVSKELNEAKYFSLGYNDDAQEYFNYKTLDQDVDKIREEILALNHLESGNPLVPYGAMNGQKCVINKVQFINHRWIIADFYSGAVHGEVLIKYFYNPEQPTNFSTIETVLYSTQ
ncbi:hydrolase [Myroides sp. 1354]|uniref:hydrolase n=1 Tax=unclassified Myroides TaxID=2642485 RepID=UPI002578EA8F|nr:MULTISPECIES: hydrolase [unclassified Myroides]MDM1046082.1 hydrolase [Myroides sp. R163-1]MDM1057018.1 hydrolase [Myroides sp. 1354]MDM1070213.1 hydrolase [Myroides sp. 1372]